MKPIKNRFFCNDCGKVKMLFETKEKAENFIKFNAEVIEEETGFKPERAYFCIACNGWHLTHKKENLNLKSKTEKLLDFYHYEIEQKALLLARKKETGAQIHARKVKDLKNSLNKVEQYIACLEKSKDNKAQCIEMLNEAFVELENAKSIRIVFKKSEKRIKIAEEKLNYLQNKIEPIIVIYPHRKNELEYLSGQEEYSLEQLEYALERLEYHLKQLECHVLSLAKKEEEALICAQKIEDFKKHLHKVEKCIEILGDLDRVKNSEEYKNKYIEVFNRAFIELENAKSTGVAFKKGEKMIKIAEEKLIILSKKN